MLSTLFTLWTAIFSCSWCLLGLEKEDLCLLSCGAFLFTPLHSLLRLWNAISSFYGVLFLLLFFIIKGCFLDILFCFLNSAVVKVRPVGLWWAQMLIIPLQSLTYLPQFLVKPRSFWPTASHRKRQGPKAIVSHTTLSMQGFLSFSPSIMNPRNEWTELSPDLRHSIMLPFSNCFESIKNGRIEKAEKP